MKERPMLLLAWVCVLGVMARLFGGWLWVFAISGLIYALFTVKRIGINCIARGSFLLAMFFIIYARTTSVHKEYERPFLFVEKGDSVVVEGTIENIERKKNKYQIIACETICYAKGEVIKTPRVVFTVEESDYVPGERIQVLGLVEQFEKTHNEGEFNQYQYNLGRGVALGLTKVTVTASDGRRDSIRGRLYSLRQNIGDVIDGNLSAEDAGIMRAMLVGDKSSLDENVKLLYQKNGLSHILAISGLHVTLLGFSLYKLMKRLGITAWISVPFTVAFLMCYGILVGNSISVRRAIIMLVIILIGRLLHQSEEVLNSLGIFIVISLWDNPFIIYNTGFVFSVIAMFGIALVGRSFVRYVRDRYASDVKTVIGRRLMKLVYRVLGAGGIFLATLPAVMRNYYEVPVYGIAVNLLLLPLASVLIVGGVLGVAMSGISLGICEGIARMSWRIVSLILSFYQNICGGVGKLPGASLLTGSMSSVQMVLYYAVLLMWVILLSKRMSKGDWKEFYNVAFVIIVLFLGFFRAPSGQELVMLDVGQGLGVYVHSKDMNLFYDGGSTDVYKVGQYRILPFLKSRGVGKIDYWFISHLDDDHTSGLVELIEADYKIGCIVLSKVVEQNEKYMDLLALAENKKIAIRYVLAPSSMEVAGMQISCLWPMEEQKNANDGSMVLLLNMGEDMNCLLLGDVSATVEAGIASRIPEGTIQYVQAAHHGSDYSNSVELLTKLPDSYMLISCGLDNSYGHPGKNAIQRMQSAGMEIYYTMYQGQLTITNKGIVTYRSVL